jgi:hypothetical protein
VEVVEAIQEISELAAKQSEDVAVAELGPIL